MGQTLANWNSADTGLVLSAFGFGLVASKFYSDSSFLNSIIAKRTYYKRFTNLFLAFGVFFALRNSSYRLQGYVPNGLPKKRT